MRALDGSYMDQNRIREYYDKGIEKNRLNLEYFKLEGIRTREIITRYLDRPGLRIADIGGGAGFYAFWLQSLGHSVSMVDLSPGNIELAKEYAAKQNITLSSCQIGDARDIPFQDNEFDVVLLLGPLYHLTKREDRIRSLREAGRISKPGGVILVACISRYASLLDGLKRDLIMDDQFERILLRDLETGVHENDTENPEYFTRAFFHMPQQIREEISESGLTFEELIAVESIGWIIDNLSQKKKDQRYWAKLENILRLIEGNEDLIAVSPHIIGVARKIV
jgi:ubiquinone/menaquinone biosynthesis C-methylase UbiE